MFNNRNYDYECTKKCKLQDHGNKITAALSKRSIPPEKLAAYIAKICKNFTEIRDSLGRTALHLAVSADKYIITEWLLNQGSSINAKDEESGSSPLHRAIFYGCIDCAVLLMRYGAGLDVLDDDTKFPLQSACELSKFRKNVPALNELLAWGSNKNYNLGLSNEQGSTVAQFIEFFWKNHISVELVAVSQYHSLFLDKKGILYSVGHGGGGRLGIGSENSLVAPKRVKLPMKNPQDEKIVQIRVSVNHSMLLTTKTVYACGSNEFQQLGMKPAPEKLLVFKEVPYFNQCNIENLIGISAEDCFSVAYSKMDLYVWGLNKGQFGFSDNIENILLPKKVVLPSSCRIEFAVTCSNAMIVCTTEKQILLYHNYKTKVIKPPQLESIKSIRIMTDEQHTKNLKNNTANKNELRFLLLTDTNVLYIWQNDVQQYLRCSLAHIKLSQIDKIFYKLNQVFILSHGYVYFGTCQKVPLQNSIQNNEIVWLSSGQERKDMCLNAKIRIEIKKIANIDRAVDIFCDDSFDSFAVLQENSKKYCMIPPLMAEEYNFKKLLLELNEFDGVHDLVFHIDYEIYYAHKFIIFSRAKGLKHIVENFHTKDVFINFKNFTGKMFELILKHIYSNYFLTYDDMDDIHQSLGSDFDSIERESVCEIFLEFVEKFQLNDLASNIKSYFNISDGSFVFDKTKCRFNRLKRTSFPELYDVVIKCSNNQELQAHKCILVTKLEYFNLMFSHNWAEQKFINLSTIPIEYMRPIIDFLYTADVEAFRKENFSESFLYNMIVICDQFFINRLRKICEILVLEKISIKKCGEMLDFACSYNCELLKLGCLDFICQNLARVLAQRSLENVESSSLHFINDHYRKIFKIVFDYRCITPDADAVEDAILLSFVNDFKVDLDETNADIVKHQKSPKPKLKESKTKLDRRSLEKDAISFLKEISLDEQPHKLIKSEILKEVMEIDEQLHQRSVSWTKVEEKKDIKKKFGVVNANNVLKVEEKPKEKFISLNKILKSPPERASNKENHIESHKSNFNLGDFKASLHNEKLSQKQRKRLSSTEKVELVSIVSSPIEIPKIKNHWNILEDPMKSPSTSIWNESFTDIIKSPNSKDSFESSGKFLNKLAESPTKAVKSTGAIRKSNNGSDLNFSRIIQDEKKQKDYFEKMKSKSLILTQIEETAIGELKEFYNVANIEDEIITVERKPIQTTMNFATWTKM